MKKLPLILIPALLAAGALAFAGKPQGRWHGPISIEEAKARATERFADIDTDGDGRVTQEELFSEERKAAKIAEKRQRRFDRLDADGDGAITPEEFARRVQRLEELDSNGDGEITRDEFRAGKHRWGSKRRGKG